MRQFSFLLILFTLLIGSLSSAKAQCFEIESILVDACGLPEGENEMVRIQVGNADLNVSDLVITWPSNPYRGICQDAQTASHVAALNNTILACGLILEPSGGVLPAGSRVILVTSTNMNPSFNSFANLSDTIYMIFQCFGNTAGHFRNYGVGFGARTLTMNFAACSDAVTYIVDSLIDQSGAHAAGDGATVEFDAAGTATYTNPGCQAPIVPLNASLSSSSSAVCSGDQVTVSAVISGTNYLSYFWADGAGTYGNPNALTTTYTTSSIFTGNDQLLFGIVGTCQDTVYDTLYINVSSGSIPAITASGPTTFCQGGSVTLTASTAGSYLWSNQATTQSITVSTSGTYTVTVSGSCGNGTASATVDVLAQPNAQVSATSNFLCPGESSTLTATGGTTYLWSPGGQTTASITVSDPGFYNCTVSNLCGSNTAGMQILASTLIVDLDADTISGPVPHTVNFTNNSTNDVTHSWDFGDGSTSTAENPQHTYIIPGVYLVTLTAEGPGGCISTDTVTIFVIDDTQISVPNVFTPNSDGKNDFFNITTNKTNLSVSGQIFNRWGKEIASWNTLTRGWNGESSGGSEAAAGTYYYLIKITLLNGSTREYNGTVTLLR